MRSRPGWIKAQGPHCGLREVRQVGGALLGEGSRQEVRGPHTAARERGSRDGFLEVLRAERLRRGSRGCGKGMSRMEAPCPGSCRNQCGQVRICMWGWVEEATDLTMT